MDIEDRLKQNDIDEEFARFCTALLPDAKAAVGAIVERYGWSETLAIAGILPWHLILLGKLSLGKKRTFRLPHAVNSGAEQNEAQVHQVDGVAETGHDHCRPMEVETSGSEPTLFDAMLLMLGRYISMDDHGAGDDALICELTKKGQALINLNEQFTRADSDRVYEQVHLTKRVREILADVIQACIHEFEQAIPEPSSQPLENGALSSPWSQLMS